MKTMNGKWSFLEATQADSSRKRNTATMSPLPLSADNNNGDKNGKNDAATTDTVFGVPRQ
jgi:hypothetical protein